MAFSGGDYIALGMFTLALIGIVARELRAALSKNSANAAADATAESFSALVTAKLNDVIDEIKGLEQKRQKHELDCARIQERTAASLERMAERLDRHDRSIEQVQSQVRHVVSGSADKIIEITDVRPGHKRPLI